MDPAQLESPRHPDAPPPDLAWMRREPRVSLSVMGALYLLALLWSGPPPPSPGRAPADRFSAARAIETLSRILGPVVGPLVDQREPHPVGSAAHEGVRERLCAELARIGLEPSVQEALVQGSHENVALVRNVLARIPGRERAPAVMIASHYDSVGAGPGAGDDGAGVAAALEVARVLRAGPVLRHDVILLFTDGEELGLLGARAFCDEHPWAREVAVAVNLEGRGTEGPSSMFETSERNGALIELFARVVPRPSAVSAAYEIYRRMPNDTDMTIFKRAGMAGYNFAFIGGVHRYHTPRDDLAHLDAGSVQHHGDNALPLVRALADGELPIATRGNATYADLFGLVLVHWPESYAIPVALVELALLASAAIALRRARAITWAGVARGAALWIEFVGGAAIAGFASQRIAIALSGAPEPWRAHGTLMAVVVAASTLIAAAIAARFAAARARPLDAWLGMWCLVAALGVAVAIAVPSASYLFAIPCGVAAVVAPAIALRPGIAKSPIAPVAMLAPLAAAASVFFALAIGLTLAFEYHLCALTAATLAIVVAGAVPGWLPLARERMRTLLASCGIVWLGALALLVRSAPTSFDDPAPLAFAHVVDADRREERSLAASFGWKLPADMLRRSGALPAFTSTERNSLGWWTHDATLQSTPWRALAPESVPATPRCRVARDDRTPSKRIVKLELRSTRDAAAAIVRVSRGAEIRSIELRGHALELGSAVVVSPVRVLNVIGGRGDPIELTIDAPADGSIELEIEDADRLLPSEAPALFQARPDTRVPIGHGGDVSIVVHRERI